MNQADPLTVPHLIGTAIRAIACGGLRIYALNCCQTSDEFQKLWQILEELNRRSQEPKLRRFPPLLFAPEIKSTFMRHRCADAEFQLVRMATAAKYRFVTHRSVPSSAEEFGPLLPEGPPQDPFTTAPLKFFSDPNLFTCYSIGSDEQDNRAAVSYDPTNGTISGGDIVFEIPH